MIQKASDELCASVGKVPPPAGGQTSAVESTGAAAPTPTYVPNGAKAATYLVIAAAWIAAIAWSVSEHRKAEALVPAGAHEDDRDMTAEAV